MREQSIRSLLLLDANVDERRLVSAIASRAGWTVVGAADCEAATTYLQGQHGREVQAALLGSWNSEQGPSVIESLRGPEFCSRADHSLNDFDSGFERR